MPARFVHALLILNELLDYDLFKEIPVEHTSELERTYFMLHSSFALGDRGQLTLLSTIGVDSEFPKGVLSSELRFISSLE